MALECFGSFENERTVEPAVLEGPSGDLEMRLEFDRTTYPGGRVDFELEVELAADADLEAHREALARLFDEAGVVSFTQSSKLGRFVEIMNDNESENDEVHDG